MTPTVWNNIICLIIIITFPFFLIFYPYIFHSSNLNLNLDLFFNRSLSSMHKQINSSMMHKIHVFIWFFFICYLTTLLLLKWECTKKNKKEFKEKYPLIYLTNHFILLLFFIPILGFTNPTPLNRNLVLEICKKGMYTHIVSSHMHKQKSRHDA